MTYDKFFFNFEQLCLPAAKNPIRACAHMLLQDQNIYTLGYYCVVVEEQMKVLLSASVSQPFYTEIVISNFERKVCNALKNILMRWVYFSLPTETQLLELESFPSEFSVASTSTHYHCMILLDKLIFLNWISEKSIMKILVNPTLP